MRNLWFSDPRTGKFPPLRVLWNVAWAVPCFVVGAVFVGLVLVQGGYSKAREAAAFIYG